MDKMSIAKLLLVTFPENICSIYIAFLITGDRLNLPFRDILTYRKRNISKLIITAVLFSTVQYWGRFLAKDMGTYFIINILLSIVILGIVYNKYPMIDRDKRLFSNVIDFLKVWKKPLVQVCIIVVSLSTIETIYLPPTLQALGISSMKEVYAIPWINLTLPQIDRFFQILVISALWGYQRLNQTILNYKCKKPLFIVLFVYIIAMELGFSYLYITSFSRLSNQLQVIFFILLLSMSLINILIYKVVLNIVDKIYQRHSTKGV